MYLFITFVYLRSVAGLQTNLHKSSHFDDVHHKWRLSIFYIKAARPMASGYTV